MRILFTKHTRKKPQQLFNSIAKKLDRSKKLNVDIYEKKINVHVICLKEAISIITYYNWKGCCLRFLFEIKSKVMMFIQKKKTGFHFFHA